MTDVRGIICEFLQANGYDGLAGEECGCGIDDLMVCGGQADTCVPAYRWTDCSACEELADDRYCEWEGEGGCYRTVRPAHEGAAS